MIRQISVFLENREGTLADITRTLAEAKIDLRAIFIAETSDYGILRMIVSDPEKAETVLQNNGSIVDITEVSAISVPDKPGGLAALLSLVADNGIGISYMYSVFGKDDGKAHMVFRVDDTAAFEKLLVENGFVSDTLSELK